MILGGGDCGGRCFSALLSVRLRPGGGARAVGIRGLDVHLIRTDSQDDGLGLALSKYPRRQEGKSEQGKKRFAKSFPGVMTEADRRRVSGDKAAHVLVAFDDGRLVLWRARISVNPGPNGRHSCALWPLETFGSRPKRAGCRVKCVSGRRRRGAQKT